MGEFASRACNLQIHAAVKGDIAIVLLYVYYTRTYFKTVNENISRF